MQSATLQSVVGLGTTCPWPPASRRCNVPARHAMDAVRPVHYCGRHCFTESTHCWQQLRHQRQGKARLATDVESFSGFLSYVYIWVICCRYDRLS
jgi:hypothetical protein